VTGTVTGQVMIPDIRPVLFFDSGMGGLSVLAEARRLLPQMPVVYVADNGYFPYGTRTEAEIATRVPVLLGRLAERYRPRLIVIACNTASTIALAHVRAALEVPVVGTVPAIKPAAALSQKRVIGVLGTEATVRQPYVDNLSAEFGADCTVLRYGSARLVELAEAKLRGAPPPVDATKAYRAILDGLIGQPQGENMDVVVLACTHFPLVAEELAEAAPQPLHFVDGAAGIARRIAHLTQGQSWPAHPGAGIMVLTAPMEIPPDMHANLAAFGLEDIAWL